MKNFKSIFKKTKGCQIIGMIHVDALPGTPKYYSGQFENIINKARYEAEIYKKHKLDGVIIENMNDIPYVQDTKIGPEIISSMTRIATEVRQVIPETPIGLQILACGNKQAIAIAKSTSCQFIRNEGFVFSHIADEGFVNSNAGELLRYRKQIDADNILIFTDIKKKHSSHSITDDINILETAKAAEFFLSNGVILTGKSTGDSINLNDLNEIYNKIQLPIFLGSGVTSENFKDYFHKVDSVIVGSYFKLDGQWNNDLCEKRISEFMKVANDLELSSLKN